MLKALHTGLNIFLYILEIGLAKKNHQTEKQTDQLGRFRSENEKGVTSVGASNRPTLIGVEGG